MPSPSQAAAAAAGDAKSPGSGKGAGGSDKAGVGDGGAPSAKKVNVTKILRKDHQKEMGNKGPRDPRNLVLGRDDMLVADRARDALDVLAKDWAPGRYLACVLAAVFGCVVGGGRRRATVAQPSSCVWLVVGARPDARRAPRHTRRDPHAACVCGFGLPLVCVARRRLL